jgi:methylthioribose-1-phosphate isomerase
MSDSFATIRWDGDANGYLALLDQTRLPTETVYLDCRTVEEIWHAIRRLSVRGAPAIGVAAAYAVVVGVRNGRDVNEICDYLATSRPTAVNLFWALNRMRQAAHHALQSHNCRDIRSAAEPSPNPSLSGRGNALGERLLAEARAIHEEDRQQCAAIGRHGADLLAELPTGVGILTHCNAGALATGGEGTALAVIFELGRRGRQPHVWVDETRPLLQGARLTAWELQQRGINTTLIGDSVAAQVMREGRVQAVITGADRIAANGDTANKIGTFSVSTLARVFDIPFYVAAPVTTFDLSLTSGREIPIEQRDATEITHSFGLQTAPGNIAVYNPAFDVTPAELITAIVTDRGVIKPVNEQAIRAKMK